MKLLLMSFIFCFFITDMHAQRLNNSSMEGEPIDATMPDGWHACQEGTTPDIFPGPWGVDKDPYDGSSFIGLITRPNGSWESIGQRFSEALILKACYRMSMVCAHADTYAGYNSSGRLRVWLGKTKCDKGQLILDVPSLMHTEWKNYPINFTTKDEMEYIIIESFHPKGIQSSTGNILIDKIYAPVICAGS